MSLTVQQLLSDAKRLTLRLRDHDDSANRIVSAAQDTLKAVTEMRSYQEDLEALNAIAHHRPRAQLVLGIQQENRHIRQLQQENKELRAALEEHQNAIELIMSKYRQHMIGLVNSTKLEKNAWKQQKAKLLQDRVDKICEMATVMSQSIQLDEEGQVQEQEIMSRLITENKGLREMLEISFRNGSYSDPLVGPRLTSRECQTEDTAALSSNCRIGKEAKRPETESPPGPSCKQCQELLQPRRPFHPVHSPSVRPVSVASAASDSSEDTSSTTSEEDDEISFNTIKRQVHVRNNGFPSGDNANGDEERVIERPEKQPQLNGDHREKKDEKEPS